MIHPTYLGAIGFALLVAAIVTMFVCAEHERWDRPTAWSWVGDWCWAPALLGFALMLGAGGVVIQQGMQP